MEVEVNAPARIAVALLAVLLLLDIKWAGKVPVGAAVPVPTTTSVGEGEPK